jgi:CO/xanthine dehydrogenase Mo-binding subunit
MREAAICAGAFGVDVAQVNLTGADSDFAPHNWSTGGSRVTYMAGRAVLGAAGHVLRRMKEHASEML